MTRREEERRQAEAERVEQKRRQAAEQAALQAEEQALAAALAAEEAAQAEPAASDIQFYAAAIDSRIRDTWVRPLGSSRRDLSCTIEIQLLSNGEVVADSVRLVRSSGDPAYDRSVVAAVYKASPLPVPAGPLFERFRKLRLEFKPGSR